MPKFLKMGFETEQGVIGTSPWFFGIVSDLGPLVFPIDDQNDRVQVEGQTGARFGQMEEFFSELIVHHNHLAYHLGRKSFEESPEGGLVGKSGKSEQIQKGSVVLKNFGFVDSPQTCDDDIDQGEDMFGRRVILIALGKANFLLKPFLQSDFLTK
jgi:hypothetical protein